MESENIIKNLSINTDNKKTEIDKTGQATVTEIIEDQNLKEQRKLKKQLEKEKKEAAKKKKEEEKKTPQININSSNKITQTSTQKVQYYESNTKLTRHNIGEPIYVSQTEKNILITSALPYVNNVPHLGNLIGCVLSADVYARYCRAVGYNTLYVCGTDEYGTATETKALEEKVTPRELCDKYHELHKSIYDWFDIDFDTFGRTSTEVHTKITQEIFAKLRDNGYIKKDLVDQFRCSTCKITLSDRWIIGKCPHKICGYEEARGDQCDGCGKLMNAMELINPRCKICKDKPFQLKSPHYFIELPSVETNLREWLDKTTGEWTNNSKAITYAFINEGLKPRCITRDLKWGVEVPSDDTEMQEKVFYVWFDAPIGYLSITENFLGNNKWIEWWKNPENVKLYQFMGKDNVTFHSIIFPSTLIGTKENFTLVNQMSTTDYLNYEGKKFSKTHNTGVFGDSAKKTNIPSEVWRFYLLANRPELSDTDFKWDDFMAKNNNELLANLGNLVHRTLLFASKYYNRKIPKISFEFFSEKDETFMKKTHDYFIEYVTSLDNVKIKEGLKVLMELSSLGNAYFQDCEPWVLAKNNPSRCETVIHILINFIRLLGALAEPYMPSFSAKLYEIINVKYSEDESKFMKRVIDFTSINKENSHMFLIKMNLFPEDHEIRESLPLFRKIESSEIAEFKQIFG